MKINFSLIGKISGFEFQGSFVRFWPNSNQKSCLSQVFLIGFFFLLVPFSGWGQGPRLSNNSTVSILTCGPGQELYEAFGHSAIRVTDSSQGLDLVFNYGVFDFQQENFYGNFAKGSMRYMLGANTAEQFFNHYQRDKRTIREQVLNLDSIEKNAVLNYLSVNLLPENVEYYYDYFDNNCSTKIIELLDSALHHRVVWQFSDIEGSASFRSMIYDYTTYQDWGRFGIDLGLGSVIDRPLTGRQLNFLPDELEKSISRARIQRNRIEFPLVIQNRVLYESPTYFAASSFWFSPGFVFTVLLLITVFLWTSSEKYQRAFTILQVVVFVVVGLLGTVILSIWLFTNHKSAAWNYNLLWANPLLLLLGIGIGIGKTKTQFFLNAARYPIVFVFTCWFVLPQQLNIALVPLVASLYILCVPSKRSKPSVPVQVTTTS